MGSEKEHHRSLRSALPGILLESFIVVFSILFALAVDEWKEDSENRQLAEKSIAVFEREIEQNMARLEDLAPYHSGLREMLTRIDSTGDVRTAEDLRSTIGLEPLRPPLLTDVAWQTSLATGALTKMDFETVSALSLTYTLQARFQEQARITVPDLARPEAISDAAVPQAIRSAAVYLGEITAGEQDLKAIYEQALTQIREGRIAMSGRRSENVSAVARAGRD
jgi:hypothetical protein